MPFVVINPFPILKWTNPPNNSQRNNEYNIDPCKLFSDPDMQYKFFNGNEIVIGSLEKIKTNLRNIRIPLLERSDTIIYKRHKLMVKVQLKLTKWVPHVHQQEYYNRLTALNLPTLKERSQRGNIIQCYRILSNTSSMDLVHILPMNVDERLHGHSLKLLEERIRTSIRQHFFTNRVFHEWISLTGNIDLAPSINAFKNRLDNFYNSS
ncbi:hypothetical protein JTB14_033900 [Gonioctena quinquepunctata]|nr:hypothetical protein JTB14_033900 [Gonioctena quinquepunctata]